MLRTNATQVVFDKWLMVLGRSNILFRLRASTGAHIVLTQYVDVVTSSAYEVVLGESGNKHSAIRETVGGPLKASFEGDILDPHSGNRPYSLTIHLRFK